MDAYEEIRPWLPARIIDVHAHVSLPEHSGTISPERIAANWATEVGSLQSWEDLRSHYRQLFPGIRVSSLVFGNVFREAYTEACNEYVLRGALDAANDSRALFVTRPEWKASTIEKAIARGFIGIKPYPDLAPQQSLEVSIYDFLPRDHLEALDNLGGILMLHLPRAGRLADPDNIRELLEIREDFPRIGMVVAHVGRCFCLPTAEKALPHFSDVPDILFDTSANLNPDVFYYALEVIGPERLLFGSDLPITLMKGVREHVGEVYINYTDAPYSWNTNRKPPEEEAKYTYYLYEELKALIRAIERAGLGREEMEQIMYSNAARLLRMEQNHD